MTVTTERRLWTFQNVFAKEPQIQSYGGQCDSQ